MPNTTTLLAESRRARLRRSVLAGVAALAAVWVLDSLVDAELRHDSSFVEEVLHPQRVEAWIRLLVATLLVTLYLDRRARARLHLVSAALAEAPDGIQIASLDGKVAYSNRSMERIYGFSPEELLGKNVNEMNVDPEYASATILPELARSGRWEGELEVKHKEGRFFPIWLTTSIVRNRAGKPVGAVGIIRDISERKRAEDEQRRYAEQLEDATRLKDLFADVLRHDVLGPASAMRLSIEALQRQEHDPTATKLLQSAARSSRRLTDLVDGAAHYAKLTSVHDLDFGALDLCAILEGVLTDFEPQRAERNVRISVEAQRGCQVRANPMIAEVFSNLLSNAIKYGPVGGAITIRVRDGGDRWDVSVADTGEGVPDADKERVFTRFERLPKEGVKGTGVGLAIAKRIVVLHSGRIWVEDNPGGGSVFHVALPKASPGLGATRALPSPPR